MCFLGLIRERVWAGEGGMEHVRTVKEPKQAIPTFAQAIGLLMLVGHTTLSPSSLTYLFLTSRRINMSSSTLT